jgi:hypothetical protein
VFYNAEHLISPELDASERILWSGQSRKGVVFRGTDVFLIPFSILWCGFAIFWEFMVITSDAPFFFVLWGIPFVLVGLYFVIGRFWVESKQREKTFYGVTNERIIIISGLFSRKVKSLNLRNLSEVSLSEKADKSGTITLGASNPLFSMFGGMAWPGMGNFLPPSLEMIPNAKEVYELVRKGQRGA